MQFGYGYANVGEVSNTNGNTYLIQEESGCSVEQGGRGTTGYTFGKPVVGGFHGEVVRTEQCGAGKKNKKAKTMKKKPKKKVMRKNKNMKKKTMKKKPKVHKKKLNKTMKKKKHNKVSKK